MRLVIHQVEVFGTKVEQVLHARIVDHECREGNRPSLNQLLYFFQLVAVHVSVVNGVNIPFWFVAGDLAEHEAESSPLQHVGWHADRHVAGSLIHAHGEAVAGDSDLQVAVAGSYDHLALQGVVLERQFGDPGGNSVSSYPWHVFHLLHHFLELIEKLPLRLFSHKSRTVGTRTQVTGLETELGTLLGGDPAPPPIRPVFAADALEFIKAASAVHEADHLGDRLSEERTDIAFCNYREAVRKIELHVGSSQVGNAVFVLELVMRPDSLRHDQFENVSILRVGRTLRIWLVGKVHFAILEWC